MLHCVFQIKRAVEEDAFGGGFNSKMEEIQDCMMSCA